MEKEKLETLIIDYIDGKLNPEERATLEKELAGNEASYQLYEQLREVLKAIDASEKLEPGTRVRASFEKFLQEEIAKSKPAKVLRLQPVFYRIAATIALVLSGVAIGIWITKNNQREEELLALKKEVETTKQIMLLMLDNQQSASQRIQGVNVAMKIEKADDQVVNALVKAMNEDGNTNVRLAALEALSKFQLEPFVRTSLIRSLATQKDPVVQIALIQLLVRMKEKGVINDLQNIIEDTQTIQAVKDEAYSGILKLS